MLAHRYPLLTAFGATVDALGGDPSDADCCVFLRDLLYRLHDSQPDPELDPLWCVWPDDDGAYVPIERVWGPPLAAIRAGMSTCRTPFLVHDRADLLRPPRPYLVQGWRQLRPDGSARPKEGDTGHTMLWVALTPALVLVHDSDRDRGPRIQSRPLASLLEEFSAGIAATALKPL